MNPMQRAVQEFHTALEVPARQMPTNLPQDERQLRANLILEETNEVLDSLGFMIETGEDMSVRATPVKYPHHIADQIKELCDLLYVVFGTAVTMGVDLTDFFLAVHLNNMTKTGGDRRPDGKRLKPPDYRPVTLAPLLRRIMEEACPACADGEGGPPHFGSVTCESGGRPHCSCDMCF